MKTSIVIIILTMIYLGLKAQPSAIAQTTLSNCQTQIVTLCSQNYTTASLNVSSNQIVTLTSIIDANATALFSFTFFNNVTNTLYIPQNQFTTPPLTFTGLTNISVNAGGNGTTAFATYTIITPSTKSITVVPANSVVIPSDATGPVQIELQSSSDLVNWVNSLPGTYGNTYSNRFFRVIALEQ